MTEVAKFAGLPKQILQGDAPAGVTHENAGTFLLAHIAVSLERIADKLHEFNAEGVLTYEQHIQ